ncbi:MAG: hypothetical protein JW936_05840 [Sedimentisphaerales bacterium]|nr:hypothetical protein [Sedimentisphaerales bacterium]
MMKAIVKRMMMLGLVMLLAGNVMAAPPTVCGDPNTVYLTGDITGTGNVPDCYVDTLDLSALSSQWLESTSTLYSPDVLQDGHVGRDCSDPLNAIGEDFDEDYLLMNGVPNTEFYAALIQHDVNSSTVPVPFDQFWGPDYATYQAVAKATLVVEVTSVQQTDPALPLYCAAPGYPWTSDATYFSRDGQLDPCGNIVNPWPGVGQVWACATPSTRTEQVITGTGTVEFDVTDAVRDWAIADLLPNGLQLHPYTTPDDETDYPDIQIASSESGNGPVLKIMITDPYIAPRPSMPYVVWDHPAYVEEDETLYTNMNMECGLLDPFWCYDNGVNRMGWGATPSVYYSGMDEDPCYFYKQASRRHYSAQGYLPDDPNAWAEIITSGISFTDWNSPESWYPAYVDDWISSIQLAEANDPCAFRAVWAWGYPTELVPLVQDGTIDLIIVHARLWVYSGAMTWAQVQGIMDQGVTDGIDDKMIVGLSYINTYAGASESAVSTVLANISSQYPNSPGIAFLQSKADTSANRSLTAHCNTLSATYWPTTRFTPASWLPLYPQGDFSEDGVVDLADFALMAANWMKCSDPANAECDITY